MDQIFRFVHLIEQVYEIRRIYHESLVGFQSSSDLTRLTVAGVIGVMLQVGFSFLERGAVREKAASFVGYRKIRGLAAALLAYFAVGYALAYGSPGDGTGPCFVGASLNAFLNVPSTNYVHFCFNFVAAAMMFTIVLSATAERSTIQTYYIYSFLATGVVYAAASHWTWSKDGFLFELGLVDSAGGGTVHVLSGVSAFVAANIIGPRVGRFAPTRDGAAVPRIPFGDPQSMVGGAFMLWFAFTFFNATSGLALSGKYSAAIAVHSSSSTFLGGLAGAVFALLFLSGDLSERFVKGVLAGVVALCSCCAVVDRWAVLVISPAAVLAYRGCKAVLDSMYVDDPLDAAAMHFGGGVVSLLAVGVFAQPELVDEAHGCHYESRAASECRDFHGLFYGGSGAQLKIQALGAAVFTIYGLVASGVLFVAIKMFGVLRMRRLILNTSAQK